MKKLLKRRRKLRNNQPKLINLLEEAAAEDNKEGGCSHQQQALEAYANSPRKPWETWVNTKRPWDAQMKAFTDAVNECQQQQYKRAALEKAKQALEEAKQATGA